MKIVLDEELACGEFFLGQRDAIDGILPRHDYRFCMMGWYDAVYEKSLGRDGWHLNGMGGLEPRLRGLKAACAVRKVRVDAEVSANFERK